MKIRHPIRPYDGRDRPSWLRVLQQGALSGSLATSLVLPACSGAHDPSGPRSAGAGSGAPSFGTAGAAGASVPAGGTGAAGATVLGSGAVTLAATCTPGRWELAPHFTLSREVDYLADRMGTAVLSQVGTPCATAVDHAACEAALQTIPTTGNGRHLITTEGDHVTPWAGSPVPALLRPIDVPEEAIWLALAHGYQVDCSARISNLEQPGALGYFLIDATRPGNGCNPNDLVLATVSVDRDGNVMEAATTYLPSGGCPGRRPEGLRSRHEPRTASRLGEHFAQMAHMEAASVPAFGAIAVELVLHGAPARLVRAALRAQRDEVRHAQVTAALARRFGANPSPAVVARMPVRSLAAFALDNAIEGCVNETYAAASARHQATHAADPEVRHALSGIAADEARHAALSWAIARWVTPRLDTQARARIRAAQHDALAALAAQLHAEPHDVALAQAGVPDARAALAIHAALARSVTSRCCSRRSS
jgi:hypothetical protein